MSLETFFPREAVEALPAEGTWRAIQFSPNPAADERLNIGVIFLDKKNQCFFRVLDTAAPFRCLFGTEVQDNFYFVLQLLNESLTRKAFVSPSPQIAFGPPRFATGEAGQLVVDRLFPEVVTLARNRPIPDDDDATPAIANHKLRRRVLTEMQKLAPVVSKNLWAAKPFLVKTHEAEHELDIPLRASRRFGSLVSAHYLTAASRKTNFLSAFADLATARQFVDRNEKGALFILRPPTDKTRFTEDIQRQIDNDVDDVAWRLAKIKIDVNPAETDRRLAEEIIAWSGGR